MTELPTELRHAIENATKTLQAHKDNDLILPERKKIWSALESKNSDSGKIRRSYLALDCALQVNTIWNNSYPDNKVFDQMIQHIHKFLNNNLTETTLRKFIDKLWTELDNLSYEGEQTYANYAGYAVACAGSTAISDENIIDKNELDDSLDPYEWDASFYASLAYADGATWEGNSNNEKRLIYWNWYLNTAVKNAWGSVESF